VLTGPLGFNSQMLNESMAIAISVRRKGFLDGCRRMGYRD
jgi:hypothetical protein